MAEYIESGHADTMRAISVLKEPPASAKAPIHYRGGSQGSPDSPYGSNNADHGDEGTKKPAAEPTLFPPAKGPPALPGGPVDSWAKGRPPGVARGPGRFVG